MDESELIRRAVAGDLAAFNRLVEHYQGLAYSVAYRLLGDREAASDATQDAFLAAYGAIGRFRGGSFKAWLLRIVTNACYDAGRRIQRRPASSLDAIVDAPGGADVITDPGESPDEGALRGELMHELEELLGELPFEQRTAVVLADVHGLSYDEIADATSSSLGTVKSRINRGRSKLRDLLLARPELLPDRFRL